MSLKERRDVVALGRDAGVGARGVLFSLVRVSGSSYRRPGARMLVLNDGRTAGTLSGGCLEADLLRRATWTVRLGAVMEQFSTAFDDTAEIPYGLGCGGTVDLLAEPLGTPEADALLQAMEATLMHAQRTVVSLLPSQVEGSPLLRIVLDEGGDVLFASDALPTGQVVDLRCAARGRALDAADQHWIETVAGSAFCERLRPAQRLVIFGAGEDARPLARMAHEMGWAAVVVDGRLQRATADRFPSAACTISTSAADLPVRQADAVVLMTHSYEQDRRLLAELLPIAPRYLGLLGARHRSALLLQEASALAGLPLAHAVSRTHAPIGLELGGDGPEAVALAITAEVQHGISSQSAMPFAGSRRLALSDVERLQMDGPAFDARAENCALYGSSDGLVTAGASQDVSQ